MTVKELIDQLNKFKPTAKVLVSSDEELNTLYEGFEVTILENETQVVIFGLSGQEVDE